MAELSKLAARTADVTAAYDERKRLFDKLRDLELSDEDRAKTIDEYKQAGKHFDELRSKLDSK